jgi:hypothetical protein
MARMVEQEKPLYPKICDGVDGIEMADSITGDGHKLLNVVRICRSSVVFIRC